MRAKNLKNIPPPDDKTGDEPPGVKDSPQEERMESMREKRMEAGQTLGRGSHGFRVHGK